jgi:DNA topoisomerase IB
MDPFSRRVAARFKSKKKLESGNTVYVYSPRQVALRNSEKSTRLEHLRGKMGELRAQLRKDLKSDDPEKALTALVVALIDHTAERVGNEESASGERSGEKHFGVTGWQRDHVSFGRNSAMIQYVGKSGVKQKKKVSDKAIISALRDAYEGCEGESIFEHSFGRIDASKVNSYLKPFGITAKDLRGFHANDRMQKNLKLVRSKGGSLSEDTKAREAQLKKEFQEALDLTADDVGHESSTLRSQYLIPGLESSFLKDGTILGKMKAAAVAERFREYLNGRS